MTSVVYTKQVLAGVPFAYRLKKARYWDCNGLTAIDESATVAETLQPYGGLKYTVGQGDTLRVQIHSGLLPDYTVFPDYCGVVAPVGDFYYIGHSVYDNFTARGTPLIDIDGCYMPTLGNNIVTTFYTEGYTWEIILKIHTPKEFLADSYLFGAYSSVRYVPALCTDAEGHLKLYVASSTSAWDIADGVVSESALVADMDHCIKVSWDGEIYKVMVGIGSSPMVKYNDYITVVSGTAQYCKNSNHFNIGYQYNGKPWSGTIDLSASYLIINNSVSWRARRSVQNIYSGLLDSGIADAAAATTYNLFAKDGMPYLTTAETKDGALWCGTVKIPAHLLVTPAKGNFTIVGTPEITDNFASGFSAGNYLISSYTLPSQTFFATKMSLVTRVRTGTDSSSRNIVWDNAANSHGFGTGSSSRWRIYNGTDNYGGSWTGNTVYWVQYVQEPAANGCTMTLYYMADNGTYTLETLPAATSSKWSKAITLSGAALFGANKLRFGTGYAYPTQYWNGGIDLANTVLYGAPVGDGAAPVLWRAVDLTDSL